MTMDLGRFGAWFNPALGDDLIVSYAAEAERLGYGTVWVGMGLDEVEDLILVERILQSTERVVVATGIVNMWTNDAAAIAASYHRFEQIHPGRFLLGVGVSHPEAIAEFRRPYATMCAYFDVLDAEGVPVDRRILAALGPRSLELAGKRALGTHPYLVPAAHSRIARKALGETRIVAPEQAVLVSEDAERARHLAREFLNNPYLNLTNYVSNLLRSGYSEKDVSDGGSDRLVDEIVPHGSAERVMRQLAAHFDAGADHVAVQALGTDPTDGLRALAAVGLTA